MPIRVYKCVIFFLKNAISTPGGRGRDAWSSSIGHYRENRKMNQQGKVKRFISARKSTHLSARKLTPTRAVAGV